MNDEPPIQFPQSAEAVVATLAELFRHQGNISICNMLENAKPRIDETGYDAWDGGQYYFTLHLNLPLIVFAAIENDVPKIEKAITNKLSIVLRDTGNLHIRNVAISPILKHPPNTRAKQITPVEVEHLWEKGMLRLFLSHVSAHKEHVAKLKPEFRIYGISAFVAHEDIEPNSMWQGEIELALASMDALAALLTPDFHPSKWTDQEVGYAVGRNVVVIPVRLGQDPYGLIGKIQGLTGNLETPKNIASDVVDVLLKIETTESKMRESLVLALEKADSYISANAVTKKLAAVNYFTPEQLERIDKAGKENYNVKNSYGAPGRIINILLRFKQETAEESPF